MVKKAIFLMVLLIILLFSVALGESTWVCENCHQRVPASVGYDCPYCGNHTHHWAPATCTEPETCSCGATRGNPLGHDWLEATCTEPKKCRVCGISEGSPTGHVWIAATCTEPVYCVFCRNTVGEPLGHIWKEVTCTQPKTCSVCGATEGVALGHQWLDATCTTPKTCSVCGATEGVAGHQWLDATCTTPKTCSVCGATEGAALGHQWLDATCTTPKTCSVCGATEGAALGHQWLEATYSQPKTCSVCGATEGTALENQWLDSTVETTLTRKAEKTSMTHDEYMAADMDSQVTVCTYVQGTQDWWDNKITVYAQSPDGAYFIYNMECSEEDAAKLVPGTAILVKGYKGEWSGEIEILDATFTFAEGLAPFIAEAEDVTAKIGTNELINCQNELVCFAGMTVEPYDETGAAFAYKNAENKTDDLYFKASKDGKIMDFCVEFYLTGADTEVYKAVEGLQVGDVIDITGFLYWYGSANPHVTAVVKAR